MYMYSVLVYVVIIWCNGCTFDVLSICTDDLYTVHVHVHVKDRNIHLHVHVHVDL